MCRAQIGEARGLRGFIAQFSEAVESHLHVANALAGVTQGAAGPNGMSQSSPGPRLTGGRTTAAKAPSTMYPFLATAAQTRKRTVVLTSGRSVLRARWGPASVTVLVI